MIVVSILSLLVVISLSLFVAYNFKLNNGVPKFKDNEIDISKVEFKYKDIFEESLL